MSPGDGRRSAFQSRCPAMSVKGADMIELYHCPANVSMQLFPYLPTWYAHASTASGSHTLG